MCYCKIYFASALSKNNLNPRTKTEPVMDGAGAMVYGTVHACFFVVTYIWPINQMYSVASAPTVIGSVFKWKFILFLGQCARIG